MAKMRVVLDGNLAVEVENAEDAVRVLQAYKAATTSPPATTGSVSPAAPASAPSVPRIFPRATSAKNPARVIFKNGHYGAFADLYASADGLRTEEMVKALGLPGPKSMPPILGAWRKRAASIDLNIRDLIEVERGYGNGRPLTMYRLTARGREVFGPPETGKAQAVGGLSL